eukprot:767188-Hanusia_phi.AAC.18
MIRSAARPGVMATVTALGAAAATPARDRVTVTGGGSCLLSAWSEPVTSPGPSNSSHAAPPPLRPSLP